MATHDKPSGLERVQAYIPPEAAAKLRAAAAAANRSLSAEAELRLMKSLEQEADE